VIRDHIYALKLDRGVGSGLAMALAPAPRPADWDSFHVCDPSVVAGRFRDGNTVYRYAIFCLGNDVDASQNNQIGLALSESLDGPWRRRGPPIVPDTERGTWGTGQPSAVSANAQNGSPAAQLVRVGLSDGGKILAQFSNGQQTMVGQVAMASVRNPESLIAVGNNNFQLSARSATPAIGAPGTGGRGTILGGAIEYSTVDIAREFTNLIVLQRGYQANSRVITTVDELSQDTINLKR
jgi:hypothetical protein